MLKSSITQLLIALQLVLICSNAQLTFPSNYIKIPAPDMTFYFEFNDDTQTVNMGLDIPQAVDYFAVGFANEGNYGMVTFDIVTVIFPFDNTTNAYQATITDMYSNKSGRPSTDTDIGGTSDYILDNFYYDANGRSQALFHRAYNTKDQFDYTIDPQKVKTSIIMNWAIGTAGSHSFHTHNHGGGAAGTIISQMYNGFQGVAKDYFPGGLSPDVVLAVHGWVLLFAWGILVEVVVQIGRYRKFSRFFVSIHLALGTLLYSVTAVATGFALYIRWGDVSGTTRLAHFYLGFVIVGLCTLQVVGGLVLGIKMAAAKVTKILPIVNKGHLILGILIYLITKAQIGIGLYLFRPDLMVYLYIYYGLIIAFRIGQEYFYRVWARLSGKNTKKYITGADSQTEKHQKLLEMLNSNIPLSEIFEAPEVKDLKWAVLDDKVFELKDFTHPGGNFILNQINGREIGRFIYGSYGLESLTQNTQHLHSSHALLVVQRNLIGTIQNGQNLITPINGNDSVDYKGPGSDVSNNLNPSLSIKRVSEEPRERLLPAPKTETGVWILQNKVQLTPLISKFVFTCPDYFINPLVKDIRNIGRHMKVSHASHKKIRLYTLVLSQTEVRTRRREALWNKFLSKEKSSLVNLSEDSRFESLPLIIKKYNAPASSSDGNISTFSGFLHNCAANSTGFSIEGPFGPGLGLTLDSTGVHCIIAAGTGFFPFLDLIDFLLESLLDPNSSNKLFKNGFKLHLFLSFNEMSDFVGLDMCEKLIQACRERGLEGAVKMTIRAKDAKNNDLYAVTKEVFDNAFVERCVNRNSVRVFVCGPPVFNQQIPSALSLIGIPKSGIVLV